MLNHRLPSFSARPSSRGGFTLIELLVVIAIIGVLASVTVPAVMGGLAKAKQNVGMQNARSIALLMFQYSIDNSNQYPPDNTQGGSTTYTGSSGAFEQIINNKYTTSATIFFLPGGTATAAYTGSSPGTGLSSSNVSWDVTGLSKTQGITSNADPGLPLVFTNGNTINYPTGSGGTVMTAKTGKSNPFQNQGIPVCYVGNNAVFKTVNDPDGVTIDKFIDASVNPNSATYIDVTP